jgi:putative ABC transport system permease protein
VGQFLAEAGLVTALSVGGAVLLARLALPVFNAVAETALSAALLWSGPVLGGLAVLVLLVTLGAGSYPALVLSRFQPAEVLRSGGRTHTGSQGARLRKGLVVVQFAISVALIAGTLVVRAQFDYIQSKRLGLDTERVVAIERADDLGRQQQAFLNQVQRLPGVTATGAADALYAGGVSSGVFRPEGRPRSDAQSFNYLWTGFGVTDALSLTLVQGRSFSPERASDSTAVLINEAAAQRLGWETPVGKTLTTPLSSAADRPYTIIGVVENFHFASLRRAIQPLVLLPHATLDRAYIRLQAGPSTDALRDVEDVWTRFAAGVPFQYAFVDQQYDALHRSTQRTGQLFLGFAGLAILIAGLGLFGLATYTAQRRTQEIGIRKALGASVLSIVRLLSADVLRRVAVGVGLGLPLAYLGLQRWLANFAYRMDMGIGLFLGAAALALGIALLTVGAQAARAARIDPAQTLRSE